MRIDSEVRKADHMDDKYEQYNWFLFRPEQECHDSDLVLMGRMMSALDKNNCGYKLNYGLDHHITSLEIKESYIMKFLTNILWKSNNVQ